MKTTSSNEPIRPGLTDRRIQLMLSAPLLLFVLLRGAAVLMDTFEVRLWGLDFAGWLPQSAMLQLLLWLPLLFAYPLLRQTSESKQVRERERRAGRSDQERKKGSGRENSAHVFQSSRLFPVILLTLGTGVIAGVVQVAYAFLGDGTWYAAELYRSMGDPGYANSMIKPSAWLTGIVLDGYARAMQPEDIRVPFQYAGIAGMILSAGAIFWLTRRETLLKVVVAVTVIMAAAGTLVFFGYIELYAFVYAFSIAYFVAAWQCLRGNASVWLTGVFLLLAVLFGASAVIWLPSYLLLLHWKFRGEEGNFPLRRAAALLATLPICAIAAAYILGLAEGDSAYFVALAPFDRVMDGLSTGWQRYTLFAGERWVDILNALFLTLGGGLLLLPALLWIAKREGRLRSPIVLFGITSGVGGFLLLLFGNTFLGLARDWDVAALAGLGMLALALFLLLEVTNERPGVLRAILPLLFAVCFSQVALWTAVNTDEEASARRFATLVGMDAGLVLPMNTFTGYENLRKFYHSGAQEDEYLHTMRAMIATGYRRDVSYAEYLSATLQLRIAERRRAELQWLMNVLLEDIYEDNGGEQSPAAPPRFYREFSVRLLISSWQLGERVLVNEGLKYFGELLHNWPERVLIDLQIVDPFPSDAPARLLGALDDETEDAYLMMTAAELHARSGSHKQASRLYDQALDREPTLYPSWYLAAAAFHLNITGDREIARRYLEACVHNAPQSGPAQQAAELLHTLQ